MEILDLEWMQVEKSIYAVKRLANGFVVNLLVPLLVIICVLRMIKKEKQNPQTHQI